ncbi:MAG: hypothetical protein ACYSWU_20490, partial [Planctomycetota bacterium]
LDEAAHLWACCGVTRIDFGLDLRYGADRRQAPIRDELTHVTMTVIEVWIPGVSGVRRECVWGLATVWPQFGACSDLPSRELLPGCDSVPINGTPVTSERKSSG